jgi:DNA-binding NarL/FixJ family response regulator
MKTTKVKILLADDHAIILDGLQALLDKEPEIEIVGRAHTGEEVLEIMRAQPVDVAILDISMPPGMSGIEAAKFIRRRHPAAKVILLTMSGDGHFILNALATGVHGYVMKEKSKEHLLAAIRAVTNGATYFPPELLNRFSAQGGLTDEPEEVQLTKRETEILLVVAKDPDLTSKEIGDQLFIERATVDRHIQNMKEKLGVKTRAALVKYALNRKLDKP